MYLLPVHIYFTYIYIHIYYYYIQFHTFHTKHAYKYIPWCNSCLLNTYNDLHYLHTLFSILYHNINQTYMTSIYVVITYIFLIHKHAINIIYQTYKPNYQLSQNHYVSINIFITFYMHNYLHIYTFHVYIAHTVHLHIVALYKSVTVYLIMHIHISGVYNACMPHIH